VSGKSLKVEPLEFTPEQQAQLDRIREWEERSGKISYYVGGPPPKEAREKFKKGLCPHCGKELGIEPYKQGEAYCDSCDAIFPRALWGR